MTPVQVACLTSRVSLEGGRYWLYPYLKHCLHGCFRAAQSWLGEHTYTLITTYQRRGNVRGFVIYQIGYANTERFSLTECSTTGQGKRPCWSLLKAARCLPIRQHA